MELEEKYLTPTQREKLPYALKAGIIKSKMAKEGKVKAMPKKPKKMKYSK